MNKPALTKPGSGWIRHLVRRRESYRTTWKLRISILLFFIVIIPATHRFWSRKIAQSLICSEQIVRSDAFLVENFDPDYLVFERTEALQRAGAGSKAYVPVVTEGDTDNPNFIANGLVKLMAGVSRLQKIEVIPIHESEPISLNAARQIRDVLVKEGVKSIIVVTPRFRSRRSLLVYNAVLAPVGITVRCVPSNGTKNADNWTDTWHGIQEVVEQFVKLQYYRFWVLRYKL